MSRHAGRISAVEEFGLHSVGFVGHLGGNEGVVQAGLLLPLKQGCDAISTTMKMSFTVKGGHNMVTCLQLIMDFLEANQPLLGRILGPFRGCCTSQKS